MFEQFRRLFEEARSLAAWFFPPEPEGTEYTQRATTWALGEVGINEYRHVSGQEHTDPARRQWETGTSGRDYGSGRTETSGYTAKNTAQQTSGREESFSKTGAEDISAAGRMFWERAKERHGRMFSQPGGTNPPAADIRRMYSEPFPALTADGKEWADRFTPYGGSEEQMVYFHGQKDPPAQVRKEAGGVKRSVLQTRWPPIGLGLLEDMETPMERISDFLQVDARRFSAQDIAEG